jgi:hypothetical protein
MRIVLTDQRGVFVEAVVLGLRFELRSLGFGYLAADSGDDAVPSLCRSRDVLVKSHQL